MSAPEPPALDDRLLELLRSLHPGRRVTSVQLSGWLSVPEPRNLIEQALEALHDARLAQVWRGRGTADLWAAISPAQRTEQARAEGAILCHRRPLTHHDLDAVDSFRAFLAARGPR